ncbi:hypothetical protein RCO28_30590 [Streptomyces sp. LHD-70]|uniref:hypothetical protein n=1 Tax=Streptomyces sp. LHD-70 TaxID=3072140 RepID=UPI00280FB09B|nr:hypothetical protein [Streptomyces sp. LHD-70]MDQ8706787.1 hypothetical protein [Streptomyces sp. LHD-70]
MRGGRLRFRGALRRGRNRRTVAAGLAMAAAALAAAGPPGFAGSTGSPGSEAEGEHTAPSAEPDDHPGSVRQLVRAPVRIADAETVRLLRPGDRVDVIAAPASGARASRIAAGARVIDVAAGGQASGENGALIVLSVPRAEAVRLAGASANSRLVVVLC